MRRREVSNVRRERRSMRAVARVAVLLACLTLVELPLIKDLPMQLTSKRSFLRQRAIRQPGAEAVMFTLQ